MDELAQTVLMHLKRSSTPVDAKLVKFNELKSDIKHQRVPETAQPIIFDCIKLAIGSQTSSSLISSGFSALGHLIKRLTLQNQDSAISSNAGRLFPVLLDRLGDARESHRTAASQTIQELEPYCTSDVERLVRDTALVGTNARAKEMGMEWVVHMSKNGLAFKTYVPKLVANLEDPDGGVRDVAKHSIVELFRDAPDHAKADLKKQMTKFAVRTSIVSGIVSQLGMGHVEPAELHASTASVATHSTHSSATYSHLQPDTGIAESVLSASVASEAPSTSSDYQMEPAYAHSQRELEDMFRLMAPCFEGKESEGNWMQRDKNVMQIRRLNKGNSPSDYLQPFLTGVKSLLDGILKVANSLRTTMSTNGCQCIQELAKTLGPAIDNMVEILLQSFIKMTAATKKIAANNANTTVDILFQNVSYNNRNLNHVWLACQDKNVQPRNFASGWLKTIIKKHAPHRSVFEHAGGLETVEMCLKKGLQDPTPTVREGMRATYWIFAPLWPDKAEALKDGLEKKYKDALEKDPRNPNAPAGASQSSSFSKSVGPSGSRPNIRDAIAQQRKAAAHKLNGSDRPTSAMSTFSPVKSSSSKVQDRAPSSLSNSRTARTTSTTSSSSTNTRPPSRPQSTATATPSAGGTSGLMSAPMRRPRPPPRPATADPYASRRMKEAVTPNLSPAGTPIRETTTKKSVNTKSAIRPRTPANTNRPSPTTSPSKVKAKVDSGLRRKPSIADSLRHTHGASPHASPSKVDEEMTLVLPHSKMTGSVSRKRMEKPMSMDTGMLRAEEDEFTLVKPDMVSHGTRLGTPGALVSARGLYAKLDFGSPVTASRTPRLKSPERSVEREQEEVKVYEDPFAEDDDAPVIEDEKPVLEELQLNEANLERRGSESLDNTPAIADLIIGSTSGPKPIVTEQDRTEVMRSRRLLVSGIDRISTRNLDAHGFRRLQELVKSNLDIWGENKFPELLLGLLDFLETPIEDLKTQPLKAQNLKTQALATTRAMLTLHKLEARPYHSKALKAVLRARMAFEGTAHITAELQRTADDIVRVSLSSELLDSVLDFADSVGVVSKPAENEAPGVLSPPLAPSEFPSRALTAALSVISQILVLAAQPAPRPKSPVKSASRSPSKQGPRLTLSYTQTQRLGHTAVHFLGDAEPDVRKANLEFCVALHEWFLNGTGVGGLSGASEKEREEAFWKILGLHKDSEGKEKNGVRDQSLNLITYYLARRNRT